MGKLAVYKYFAAMFLVAQIVVTIFTFVALFGGDVNPAGNTARAMLVYVLPLLILANVLLLFYWLIRRRWYFALIPVITIACCIPYIGTLYQFGTPDKTTIRGEGLKIATYNVANFSRETSGFMAQDILGKMKGMEIGILCLQEYNETSGDKNNTETFKKYFPYAVKGKEDMIIFSRYPIKGSKTISFDNTNNSAMWVDIEVKGREIRIFNCHLQTTGINHSLGKAAKMEAVQQQLGYDVSKSRALSMIYGNYTMGIIIRAGQAITIANEKRNSDKPCIVCGDFNDVPYSFTYKTMLGNMVDGFKECGAGYMTTHRGSTRSERGMLSNRIDYIFHDKSLKGLTYLRGGMTISDHYPIYMKFAI